MKKKEKNFKRNNSNIIFLKNYIKFYFFFFSGLLKVAELLRVKGLVEGESDKLLNSHLGKNGRPLVTTSMTDPPTSSSKLNGGSGGDSSRQTGNGNNGDDRRSTSDSNKDSPNGGMRFMLPSQAGMPQLPMPFLPGMFPNLLGMCVLSQKRRN